MKKMNRILFSLLIVVALVMAGCQLDGFSAEIGGEDAALVNKAANENATGALSITGAAYTLSNAKDQTITITFTGVVDVDGTTIPGLTLYNLTTNATAGEAKTRGAAIPYTAEVFATGSNASDVVLTMDLTSASNPIELYVDAATISGNSNSLFLNTDGDNIVQESEDDIVGELAVTGGTAATGGIRAPQATVTITPPALGGGQISSTITDTAVPATHNFTLATLNAAVSVEKMQSGSYAPFSHTPTYSTTTGLYAIPADTTTAGTVYKVSTNLYGIVENKAINGYIHRVSFDQLIDNNMGDNYDIITVGSIPAFTILTQDAPAHGQPVITIDSDGTYVDIDAVTSANVSVLVYEDSFDVTSEKSFIAPFTVDKVDDNTFKLYLPANLGIDTSYSYKVTIQPTVTDKGASLTVTTDDLIHVSTATRDGVFRLSGNF